jgi:hypothetical protein
MVVKLFIDYLYKSEYETKLLIITREKQAGIWTIPVRSAMACTYDCPHTCLELYKYRQRKVYKPYTCEQYCNFNCFNIACKICTTLQLPDAESNQLLVYSRLNEINEKYNVLALKNLARDKFE